MNRFLVGRLFFSRLCKQASISRRDILTAGAAALLIVLLPVLVGGPAMALSDEGSPSMALSAATFDAGKVKEGKKIDHTFEFENIGKGDLRILDIASG